MRRAAPWPRPAGSTSCCACSAASELLGACALYLKSHSYGEYVFDWAWADAYQRHGLHYYPKLLSAVPFTPVPGSRLLARDAASRARCCCRRCGRSAHGGELSSAHLLFMDDADREAAADEGWMLRQTVQFHWLNRRPAGYADFDDFLASLQRDKRKKIAQERRRVAEAGVQLHGARRRSRSTPTLWDFFYHCYTLHLRRAPLDALPDARLLRAHAAARWRGTG